MTRKAVSIYMAMTCATSIVIPGRFAIGIIFAFEALFINFLGTLFRCLLNILKVKQVVSVLMCVFIVSMTIIFKQLLILFMPQTAMQLSFVLYLPAISSFSTAFLFDEERFSLVDDIKNTISPAVVFSIYMVIVTLFRDIFGYGTLTFPAPRKMIEISLFPENYVFAGSFIATIPGALIFSAVLLCLFLEVENKFQILSRAGVQK